MLSKTSGLFLCGIFLFGGCNEIGLVELSSEDTTNILSKIDATSEELRSCEELNIKDENDLAECRARPECGAMVFPFVVDDDELGLQLCVTRATVACEDINMQTNVGYDICQERMDCRQDIAYDGYPGGGGTPICVTRECRYYDVSTLEGEEACLLNVNCKVEERNARKFCVLNTCKDYDMQKAGAEAACLARSECLLVSDGTGLFCTDKPCAELDVSIPEEQIACYQREECRAITEPEECPPWTICPTVACVGRCDDYLGLASRDDIELSPRPDEEAELLALQASGALLASSDLYALVSSDLTTIRSIHPELESVRAQPWSFVTNYLLLEVDESIQNEIINKTFSAWDCPNEYYQVVQVNTHLLGFSNWVILRFEGLFRTPLLVAEYEKLPGMISVQALRVGGKGSNICLVDQTQTEGTRTYVFDQGLGDCDSGCSFHEYWGYQTSSSGKPVFLGYFMKGQPPPTWFDDCADVL